MKAVTQKNPDGSYTAHIEDHEGEGPVGHGDTPIEALLYLAGNLHKADETEAVIVAICAVLLQSKTMPIAVVTA